MERQLESLSIIIIFKSYLSSAKFDTVIPTETLPLIAAISGPVVINRD
jgi:hypothetical protein